MLRISENAVSTVELRALLRESIGRIDDVEFLETLREMIESRNNSWNESQLPQWQRKRIEESERQIARGEFKTNEEVFRSIDEWLNK